MSQGNIEILSEGMAFSEEFSLESSFDEESRGGASNSAFMCSCIFNGGCLGGASISIQIPF